MSSGKKGFVYATRDMANKANHIEQIARKENPQSNQSKDHGEIVAIASKKSVKHIYLSGFVFLVRFVYLSAFSFYADFNDDVNTFDAVLEY